MLQIKVNQKQNINKYYGEINKIILIWDKMYITFINTFKNLLYNAKKINQLNLLCVCFKSYRKQDQK